MTEQPLATTSKAGDKTNPHFQTLQPAVVDYLVRAYPAENPLGLKALQHQVTFKVWKVLVDQDRQVMQMLGLVSCTTMDDRYLIN